MELEQADGSDRDFTKDMIVKPGKYAPPVGFIMKDKTSPSIPTSIAGTGPNIEPVIAIGKNALLSFTLLPKKGKVLLPMNPRMILSASNIAIMASDLTDFNSKKELKNFLETDIYFPPKDFFGVALGEKEKRTETLPAISPKVTAGCEICTAG